jgi:hypothetical protein
LEPYMKCRGLRYKMLSEDRIWKEINLLSGL